ncbi:MAG: DNA translocase FtsK 4TM domain-containing protein [Nitriliruptorales bacterium]
MPTATRARARPAARRSSRTSPIKALTRVSRALRTQLEDQLSDIYGVGLILLGVLSGLGLYLGKAGAVGAALNALSRGLLGIFGYLVPPLLVYLGVVLVDRHPAPQRGRRMIGATLTLTAALAGWHLLAGGPDPIDGVRALWPAGGMLGWALSRPLQMGLGTWGAAAVILAVLSLGLLIFTKTSLSTVWRSLLPRPRGGRRPVRDLQADVPYYGHLSEEGEENSEHHSEEDSEQDPPTEGAPIVPASTGRAVLRLDGVLEEPEADADTLFAPAPAWTGGSGQATKLKPPSDSWDDYELPPLDLLASGLAISTATARRQSGAQARALQATFEQFGVDAVVARTSRGPTVTRFEVELGPGVQVKKVTGLAHDIAYALAAPDVRIVAPIPGKSAIGVEVPNRERDRITLRDILDSDEARLDPHPMRVALGVDIAGKPALVHLTTMPHLLISGATGSGKSVTLNAMITSILMRARPNQVRMVLIDPKRVELNHYEGAPHLLTSVITDPRRATAALEWVVKEMEVRYETLAMLGFRNLDSYNHAVAAQAWSPPGASPPLHPDDPDRPGFRHLPYLLVVIDELADLMLVAPRDVEEAICRIAQMARAVGIHLVIATQRPSVDVITGLIKANIPSRLALATASQTDSRTILDQAGAEKLVGNGDMLFLPSSQGKPSRLQGCYVSEHEIDAVVAFTKRQREVDYVEGIIPESGGDELDLSHHEDNDDKVLVRKAIELVVRSGLGSTSMLQRKLRIGFARAGRLMDELEERGVVGPSEGSKAREVLWTVEDLEARAL